MKSVSVRSTLKKFKIQLLAVTINILFFVLVLFFAGIKFDTNDDNAMQLILYGASGVASAHLVYINVLIGYVLKLIGMLIPSVPWYSVFLTLVLLFSFSMMSVIMMERDFERGLFLTFAMLIFFGMSAYARMQFSKVAAAATVAGGFALYYGILDKIRWNRVIQGAFLLVIGIGLRFDMFYCCLFMLSGLAIKYIYEHRNSIQQIGRTILIVGCVLAICLGVRLVDICSYKMDPQLRYYTEFNDLRSIVTDFTFWPEYQKNEEMYQQLGISEYDREMFRKWDFADKNVVNLESIKEIVSHTERHTIEEGWQLFREVYPSFLFHYTCFYGFVLLLLLMFFLIKKQWIGIVYVLIAVSGMEFFLVYQGRYGLERVDWGILFAASVFCIICLQDKYQEKKRYYFERCGIAVLLVFAIMQLRAYHKDYIFLNNYIANAIELANVVAKDKEHLYVFSTLDADGYTCAIDYGDRCEVGHYDNIMVMGGWTTYLPNSEAPYAKYGIANMFSDVIDAEKVYVVNTENIELYIDYLRRHYNVDSYAFLIKSIDGTNFYSIRSKDLELDINEYRDGLPDNGIESLQGEWTSDGIHISGNIFIQGESSYKGRAYIETITKNGAVYYNDMVQYEGGTTEDDLSGKYSCYDATIRINTDEIQECRVWYLLNDKWYLVRKFSN